MKKIIFLLYLMFILCNNFNIIAMDQIKLLTIIQDGTMSNSYFVEQTFCNAKTKIFKNSPYNKELGIDKNITDFLSDQNSDNSNKKYCIYASNNNLKATIAALINLKPNNNITLIMDEPKKVDIHSESDVKEIIQLPDNIKPIIVYDRLKEEPYQNPLPHIPKIGYTLCNYFIDHSYTSFICSNLDDTFVDAYERITTSISPANNSHKIHSLRLPTSEKSEIKKNISFYESIKLKIKSNSLLIISNTFLLFLLLYQSGTINLNIIKVFTS